MRNTQGCFFLFFAKKWVNELALADVIACSTDIPTAVSGWQASVGNATLKY